MASSNLQHSKCGFFTLADSQTNAQYVVNAVTGEAVRILRTPEIIAENRYYHVKFTNSGWGKLVYAGCTAPVLMKTVAFKRVAVSSLDAGQVGRIAIQDTIAGTVKWLDECHDKVTKTFEISHDWKLVFTHYLVERRKAETILVSPHVRGGNHLWEMRCIHACLADAEGISGGKPEKWDSQYGSDDWCSRNFERSLAYWIKQAGPHPESHWLRSHKSWKMRAEAHHFMKLV